MSSYYYYYSRGPDTYRIEAQDLQQALSFAAFDLNHQTAQPEKIVMPSGITCNRVSVLDMLRKRKTVESMPVETKQLKDGQEEESSKKGCETGA